VGQKEQIIVPSGGTDAKDKTLGVRYSNGVLLAQGNIVAMATPFESAQLNLKLFELRREPVLREARAWFTREFNPESFEELLALMRGERSASFRMVLGYWDMAASLVTTGAVDVEAFCAAHSEIFATFSKIYPFLAELREASGEPELCKHMESVILSTPDAVAVMDRRRVRLRAAAEAREAKLNANLR
jgi:hypothetical protein